MMSALLRSWNALDIAQVRRRRLPQRLLPYVPQGGSVLDVGSGNGDIAHRLQRDGGAASVCGIDVIAYPDPLVPTVAFDGARIPYDDHTFDLVTLIDVLHHTDHPGRLLAEAVRVSRGRVVIKDHYWVTPFDRWVLSLSDYLGNKADGVALPYTFLRLEQWAALFDDLGLTVVSSERFLYAPYDRSRHVIFAVEPIADPPPAGAGTSS